MTDSYDEIRARLVEVRDEFFEGNEAEMARETGITRPTLHNILSGKTRKISASVVRSVVKASPVEFNWLMNGQGEKLRREGDELAGQEEEVPAFAEVAAQLNVKAFSVRAGGGSVGGVVVDERVTGEYVIDLVEIESLYDHRPNSPFVMEMIGESMEPDFRSGDRLIIEPYPRGTREIQASAIYLFRLEGLVEIKQIEYLPGQRLLVRPRNPAYREYEVMMFDEIDYEILGRVWGKFKRY